LTSISNNDLFSLGDLNLAEFNREFARWNEKYEIIESDDLLMTLGADAFPGANFVMRLAPACTPLANELLDRAMAFFQARQRGFSIHVRRHIDTDLEAACEAAGMFKVGNSAGMCLDAPLPDKPEDGSVQVRVIEERQGAVDFADVTVASYKSLGLPEETGKKMFAAPERMLKPHIVPVVAYDHGVPVSAAMALMSHGIAGIYWVGTVETHRRRGLAELCTRIAGNRAFAMGATRVVLQASHMGEPVYQGMGYREFTRYPWYMWFYKKRG
jgi:ribosomal protein S18 acetylase RimI-like enzyme